MNKFVFKSIKTRLIFWFLFIALTPLLIALVVTYVQRVSVFEARTIDKLTAIRNLKVQQLEYWIDERMRDMNEISGDYEIRGLEKIFDKKLKSTDDFKKLEIASQLLNRYLGNYEEYREVFIIGANTGLVELSSNPGSLGENKSQNSYYTVPLETGAFYIKDIYNSPPKNEPEMACAKPIFCMEHGTHIIGILVARINLNNSLYKLLLNRVGLGETGETLIVNKDVLALNELRWYENAPLNLKISAEPAENAAQGKTGITITSDYRGERVLAAYTYIPETGWGFVCKQDIYELNAPIRNAILDFIILFFISAVVIYLVAFLIGNSISKPVIKMSVLADKIKTGDFSVRNGIHSQDELASLAESINEMATSIESTIFVQNGVKNVTETLVRQTTMQDFGYALLKLFMELTASNMSVFYVLNELTDEFDPITSMGVDAELLKPVNPESLDSEFGQAFIKKRINYVRDIPDNNFLKFLPIAEDAAPKEIIIVPILIEDIIVALISIVNNGRFSKEGYDVIEKSWLNINASYSSLIANERTRILAENLSKANQNLESKTKELQKQTEIVQRSSKELRSANAELEAFSYSVSHDLRAPIRAIDGFTRILAENYKSALDSEGKRLLDVVLKNTKNMGQLIDDLLAFSRMTRIKVESSLVQMEQLVKEVAKEFRDFDKDRNLEIKINQLSNVKGDRALLRQVIVNLLSNAIKFTSTREKAVIEIGNLSEDHQNIYYIKDNGVGFDMKYVHKIFDVFQRLHSAKDFEGTGVGLAIVQKIIQRHGGKIWVEAEVNKGATFYFSLPQKGDQK